MQPGDMIQPSNLQDEPPIEQTPASVPNQPAPSPDSPLPEPEDTPSQPAVGATDGAVSWEASEYVEHQKPVGWYALLGLAAVITIGVTYIISEGDYMTVGAVSVAAILFAIVAMRKPQTLRYTIDSSGVTIGSKLYSFTDFKVFSVMTETAIHSIQLFPLKRFMPPISLYFPPDEEANIVAALGLYLPYQEVRADMVDRLMSRIRF